LVAWTAYRRFARVVSGRELAESFSPNDAQVGWARGHTQDEHHLLTLVVWLKSYQRPGYFPKIAGVSSAVTGHVRGLPGQYRSAAERRPADAAPP
jgi:hypothetical protein